MPNDDNQTNSTSTNGGNNQPAIQANMPPMPSSFQSGTPSVQADTKSPQQIPSPVLTSTNVQTDAKLPQQTASPAQDQAVIQTEDTNGEKNQSPNMKDVNAVITSEHVPERLGGKKVIATIFGILFLIGGIAAGVFLAQRRQFLPSQAWNCSLYVFDVSQQGEVSVMNGQTRQEPGQKAEVSINGTLITILDVTALKAGDEATLGTVDVPSEQGFSWKVDGTVDCENSGNYEPASPEETPTTVPEPPQATPTTPPCKPKATCSQVRTYDDQWNLITDLSSVSANNTIYFSVSGTTNTGTIQKARFSVNDVSIGETTNKKPGTIDEFYIDYTIPEGTTSFSMKAELYHSEFGWF
jgi:hypothetical protein